METSYEPKSTDNSTQKPSRTDSLEYHLSRNFETTVAVAKKLSNLCCLYVTLKDAQTGIDSQTGTELQSSHVRVL